MFRLAIVSGKGGVGKSTTAIAIAGASAAAGRSTVLLDLDPNGSSSYAAGLDVDGELPPGSTALEALDGKRLYPLETTEGFKLLAGTPALEGRITRRLDRMTPIVADVLIIDAPPGFSPIAQTAVAIAEHVLVPIIAEPLATRTIEHVIGLLDGLNARAKLAGVVVTMYEPRRTITGEQVAAIEALGVSIVGYIPRSVAVAEAALVGKSIVSYAPRSPAAAAYRAIASSVLALGRGSASV